MNKQAERMMVEALLRMMGRRAGIAVLVTAIGLFHAAWIVRSGVRLSSDGKRRLLAPDWDEEESG